jgi:rhodanese-related sulfurtransferase
MKIDMDQLFESMKNDKVVVLNVLSKGDFKKLHIHGSESHPMTTDPLVFSKEVEEKYGKGKSFVVYGDRFGLLESYLAAKALEDHGLQALNYSGGLQEWHRAGLPVAGTEVAVELAANA